MEPIKLEKERTIMADERTFLAYVRTALNVFIFGFVVHRLYLENIFGSVILYVSIVCGIVLLLVGSYRFTHYAKDVDLPTK
jgi:uncharacterized membrane protein YidH (DUF202 family)